MKKEPFGREGKHTKSEIFTIPHNLADGMYIKETAEHYRSQGYDFLALTDHWVYGIHPELNRDDFLLFPGTELISSCREEKITIWWVLVCRRRTGFRNIIPLRKSKNGVLTTAERIIEYFGREEMSPCTAIPTGQDRFHGYQISAGHDRHGNLQPRF